MYDTSETFGEKASKGKKRTMTDDKETLTINQYRRHGTPTVRLHPSDGIFVIYIRCLFD